MKERLISQQNSIISIIKESKISTGKPSSWETSVQKFCYVLDVSA